SAGPGGGSTGASTTTTATAGGSGGNGGVGGATGGAGGSTGGVGGATGGVGGATGGVGGATGGSGGSGGGPKTLCTDTSTPYTKCQATDFSKEDIFNNAKWTISTWGNANRTHSLANLWVKDGILAMKVNGGTPKGQTTTGAEFASTKTNFLYGSYRTMAKTATEPGTVNSPLFYYLSDTSEIDVEILSQDNPQ